MPPGSATRRKDLHPRGCSAKKVGIATAQPAVIALLLRRAYDIAVTPSAAFGQALVLGAVYLVLLIPSAVLFLWSFS